MGAPRGVAGRRADARDLARLRRRRSAPDGGARGGRGRLTASIEVTVDAVEADADAAAAFWQAALGYADRRDRPPFIVLEPGEGDPRPAVVIQRVDGAGPSGQRVHLDLRVDDVDAEVERLRGLGATVRWTVDDTDRGGSRWTTMADPQGVLFCVATARR
ncbi:MAG TPA: VOC family protein [Actinomycetota bacterium]